MKKITVVVLALLVLLTASACKGSEEERLSALEESVKVLRQEAEARETAYREELAQVRKNLEAIQSLLQIEQGADTLKDGTTSQGAPSDDDLDAKA